MKLCVQILVALSVFSSCICIYAEPLTREAKKIGSFSKKLTEDETSTSKVTHQYAFDSKGVFILSQNQILVGNYWFVNSADFSYHDYKGKTKAEGKIAEGLLPTSNEEFGILDPDAESGDSIEPTSEFAYVPLQGTMIFLKYENLSSQQVRYVSAKIGTKGLEKIGEIIIDENAGDRLSILYITSTWILAYKEKVNKDQVVLGKKYVTFKHDLTQIGELELDLGAGNFFSADVYGKNVLVENTYALSGIYQTSYTIYDVKFTKGYRVSSGQNSQRWEPYTFPYFPTPPASAWYINKTTHQGKTKNVLIELYK